MKELEKTEKELLEKLREASLPQNQFTLSLKFNDITIAERVFSAESYSLETLSETRTHFLMKDLMRLIQKEYSDTEQRKLEEAKKNQMNKMWNDNEQNNPNKP